MRHGSLFSGIGGFDLAAEWMGWENVFHCEWMPFPRQVLHHHFPNSISYEDITKTDFTIHRGSIDILTGGFPCQPYSSAGKRLGKEDERHLWPHMLRAIQEIEPTYVVGENVRGITNWNGGLVFEEVCAELENEGYEVIPFILPACAVGAPHRRDRVWFVAHSLRSRYRRKSKKNRSNQFAKWEIYKNIGHNKYSVWCKIKRCCEITSNSESERTRKQPSTNSRWKDRRFNNDDEIWNATNTKFIRLEYRARTKQVSTTKGNSNEKRCESSLSIKTNGGAFKPNWDNFPTQSPICSGDDGLPTKLDGITFSKWRQESIKGYGNAIVPQVAYQIFNVIQMMDEN